MIAPRGEDEPGVRESAKAHGAAIDPMHPRMVKQEGHGFDEDDQRFSEGATGVADDVVVAAVAERVKFFLSDANLRQDDYLRRYLFKTSSHGVVPISLLLRFQSIQQHTKDPNVVVQAIQQHLSDTLVVTKECQFVKRRQPFTRVQMHDHISLTLVIGNLPAVDRRRNKKKNQTGNPEEDSKGSPMPSLSSNTYSMQHLIEDLKPLFSLYGQMALVKVQDKDSNVYIPKGSAVVEFEEERALQAAAAQVLTRELMRQQDGTKAMVVVAPKRILQIRGQVLTVTLLSHVMEQHKHQIQVQQEEYNTLAQRKHQQAAARRRPPSLTKTTPSMHSFEIPEWKNLPFCSGQPAFCYKLTIRPSEQQQTSDNKKQIEKQTLLAEITLGLVVPIDLLEVSRLAFRDTEQEHFEATFTLPSKLGVTVNPNPWIVELSDKYCVAPTGFSLDQLNQLRHFHRVLLNWKNYGLSYEKEMDEALLHKLQKAPSLGDCSASTGFFVPITEQHCRECSPSYRIDWSLIRHEVQRETIPFLQHLASQRETGLDSSSFLDNLAQNHVLLHRSLRHRLVGRSNNLTAQSPFPSQLQDLTEGKINFFLRRHDLDLRTATYAEYFEKRYGMFIAFRM